MPKIAYTPKSFSADHLAVIARAEAICNAYAAQGFTLTLRQLYYQFVSRQWLANKDTEYRRLGAIVKEARLAGLLDWDHLEDRGREVQENSHWTSPEALVDICAQTFQYDKWQRQPTRPIVLIEKDALASVIEPTCQALDVLFLACRGYASISEQWSMGRRIRQWKRATGQDTVVLYLGDHDPSGLDMTRDAAEKLNLFSGLDLEVRRLALNMDQVRRYAPPPNPAKSTDARFADYLKNYGEESWELDALEPQVIADLIRDAVLSVRDDELWDEAFDEEVAARKTLKLVAENWDNVVEWTDESFA